MGVHGPLAPGSTFGDLKITGLLGKGGMGAVYRAHDPKLGRDVAVKVVFREYANDPLFIERFAKEQASAALDHPHVVRVHRGGVEQGIPFLVMELLPGGSLNDRLKREGRIPWQEAARLGSQIASALAAVHAARLVHRDLKPANVLVDEEGNAKLSDFGVVRTESSQLTKTGELLGTPQYMAPEQVEGGKRVDWRADLYSLGALLYALLVGRPPFDGPGYIVINKKLAEIPTSTSSEVEDIPRSLDRLVQQLLEREPARRPESAAAVARKLDAIARGKLDDEGRGRGAVKALAVAAVLVAGGAVAAVFVHRHKTIEPPPPPPPPVVVVEKVELVVDEPKDGALVSGESVIVKGRARGATSVEVAGKAVAVGKDGVFETPVSVTSAETVIPLVALAGDRKDEKKRTVYKPPVWFLELGEGDRPPLPLPAGLGFGANKGEYVNKKDESVLVWAPPAQFTMGGPDADLGAGRGVKKQLVHEVELSGYFIGKFEVSVAQFERYTKETRAKTAIERKDTRRRIIGLNFWIYDGILGFSPEADRGIYWKYPQRPEAGAEADPTHPVTLVTAEDVDDYCKWAGLKLPTEAQWERAAAWDHHANKRSRFPWGDALPTKEGYLQAADQRFVDLNYVKAREKAFPDGTRSDPPRTVPVDANPLGASPVGALNMAGNVAEWCRDGLDGDFYADCAKQGVVKDPWLPPATSGARARRVHRGGHFASMPSEVVAQRRFYYSITYRLPSDVIGFRVCRELGE